MQTDSDELRRELRDLFERRAAGDIREKDFQRRLEQLSLALSRLVASAKLAPGESILAEHHLVYSHLKLTQSILKEPEQATVSFFASERGLLRVRARLLPDRPVSYDDADGTVVDELAYADVREIVRRSQPRWGEAATGAVMAVVALLAGRSLAVTGPMLVLLGVAGVVHGTLFATRSVELTPRGPHTGPPFTIHGIRRRGARQLLAIVRDAIARGQSA